MSGNFQGVFARSLGSPNFRNRFRGHGIAACKSKSTPESLAHGTGWTTASFALRATMPGPGQLLLVEIRTAAGPCNAVQCVLCGGPYTV
jgi:hypothetical protein